MQILFSFTYNTETKEAVVAGTIGLVQALHVLQNIALSAASQASKEKTKEPGE